MACRSYGTTLPGTLHGQRDLRRVYSPHHTPHTTTPHHHTTHHHTSATAVLQIVCTRLTPCAHSSQQGHRRIQAPTLLLLRRPPDYFTLPVPEGEGHTLLLSFIELMTVQQRGC